MGSVLFILLPEDHTYSNVFTYSERDGPIEELKIRVCQLANNSTHHRSSTSSHFLKGRVSFGNLPICLLMIIIPIILLLINPLGWGVPWGFLLN